MKNTYTFSIIDEDGELKYEKNLSAEEAVDFLISKDETATLPTSMAELETTVSIEKRHYNKKPKEATEEKAPRAARKTKYDRVAMVADIRRGLMKIPDMAKKYSVSEATIYYVAAKEGIVFRRSKKEEDGPAKPEKTAALTPEEYADLRAEMHNKDFQSGKYSLMQKIPVREVNFAVHSQNYNHYRKIRYDE